MKHLRKLVQCLAAVAVVAACDSTPDLRIAVARFQAETCTFCPGGDTEIDR